MKILAAGRSQNGWAVEVSCTGSGNGLGGCNAKLLVEHSDLFQTQRCARDEVDLFATFKCVSCGVFTDIQNYPHNIALLPTERSKFDTGK